MLDEKTLELIALLEKDGLDSRSVFYCIRKAIRAVTLGKSYAVAGQSVTRENLDSLIEAEKYFGKQCGVIRTEEMKIFTVRPMDW